MRRLLIVMAAMSAAAPAVAQHSAHHHTHEHAPAPATPPVAPPPAAALSGPRNAADTIFDADDMAAARAQLRTEHGAIVTHKLLIDRLEARVRDGRDGYAWDAQAWYGGDIDRLWLKSEGEGRIAAHPESAEVEALWSRALDPWFNLQTGIRYDFRPRPGRAHAVIGIQGLAPYWFEIDGALFLSEKGDLTARVEGEYDQRITGKLVLQPRIALDLAAQDVPDIRIGSGLSAIAAGLRLRYEPVPELAPYVGVEYERALGQTADFARAAGEDSGGWNVMVGIRTWF